MCQPIIKYFLMLVRSRRRKKGRQASSDVRPMVAPEGAPLLRNAQHFPNLFRNLKRVPGHCPRPLCGLENGLRHAVGFHGSARRTTRRFRLLHGDEGQRFCAKPAPAGRRQDVAAMGKRKKHRAFTERALPDVTLDRRGPTFLGEESCVSLPARDRARRKSADNHCADSRFPSRQCRLRPPVPMRPANA